MAIKCRIWWNDSASAYCVVASFNNEVVTALKTLIPTGSRDFDPSSKTWYIKEDYGEMIRRVAEKAFGIGSVSFTSRQVAEQGASQRAYAGAGSVTASTTTTEDAVVAFMNLVPYDAAKKAYLLSAQSLHPDKGGSPEKMARLNELWTRIEKEFYKR